MNINRFDFSKDLKGNASTTLRLLIIGKSESGKTFFTKELLKRVQKEYSHMFIISPNCSQFTDIKKSLSCCVTLCPASTLKQLIGTLEYIYTQRKQSKAYDYINGVKVFKKKFFIIMDDICLPSFIKSDICSQAFMLWRHVGISLCFIIQYPFLFISNTMKMQSTHIIFFKGTNSKSLGYYRDVLSSYEPISIIDNDIERRKITNAIIKKYTSTRRYSGLCFNQISDNLTYI
jgi:hypothetical protein